MPSYLKVKRLLDIILSIISLIFLSPVFLIFCIAIKFDSPGPVIFKQKRLGLDGRVFEIYKFRSMSEGAEKSGVYEKKGDTRVTRIGKVIRKTSIDELPQFFNILKGEMSLIGPRPPLTYHPWTYANYTDKQKKMFNVRPGVTGWAQINGRKDVEWPKRIELNIEYVDNISFYFDLVILVKTILKVVKMEGNLNVEETVVKKSSNK